MSNIFKHFEKIEQIQAGRLPYPSFVDLHTSDKCQQNCKGCAYSNKHTGEIMSYVDHKAIIRKFVEMGVRSFDFAGGGEPLLIPRVHDLFKYIKDNGAYYSVITNGLELSDKDISKEIAKSATYCRISLESPFQDIYSKYKNVPKKQFNRVVRNIRGLVDEKRSIDSETEIGLKFAVGKTLRGMNHYREAFKLAFVLDVDNAQFKALRHEPEELSENERVNEDAILSYVFVSSFGNEELKVKKWIKPFAHELIPKCWLNPLHTVVDAQGNCYICCYYYYRKDKHLIGNLFNQDFYDFWGKLDHKEKLKNIDPDECAKVDCKFFKHHLILNDALQSGKIHFL